MSIAGDDPLQRSGRVSFGGVIKEVSLACVPEAKVGDYVIVHVGLALSTVDPEEALRTLDYFREIGELAELAVEEGTRSTTEDIGRGESAVFPASGLAEPTG